MRTSARPHLSDSLAVASVDEPAAARPSVADAPPPVDTPGDSAGDRPGGGARSGLLGRVAMAVRAAHRSGVPF
ncbi:hypothetical protein WY02_17670 [Pseudonocardia sp. AL041005-10]|nr:hypothetical protein WY02_17670 [Pseudonocardia sp. AL041005-10]